MRTFIYLIKGVAMNDDLLKRAGGGNYFDELLYRICDIRSSGINKVQMIQEETKVIL